MPIAYGEPGAEAHRRLGYVKFRGEVPSHINDPSRRLVPAAVRRDLGGHEVRVMPPKPKAEFAHWFCDGEWIWPVHPDDVPGLMGRDPGMPVYVCEHQVDVD